MTSSLEAELALLMRAEGIPAWVVEYQFDPERRYRFDFAWLLDHVAVEVNGGTWGRGAHSSGRGLRRDYEKLNLAQMAGWIVLQFSADMIHDGTAIETIKRALGN